MSLALNTHLTRWALTPLRPSRPRFPNRSLPARTPPTCSWRRGRRPYAKPRRRNTRSRCLSPASSTPTRSPRRCAIESHRSEATTNMYSFGIKKEPKRKLGAPLVNSVCVCACVCVGVRPHASDWLRGGGQPEDPQCSVGCRPNQCQYVNENCAPNPGASPLFLHTDAFYTETFTSYDNTLFPR